MSFPFATAPAAVRQLAVALRAGVLVLIFLLHAVIATSQEPGPIEVTVAGLDDVLRANVLSALSLARPQEASVLAEESVRRLFARSEGEIRSALEPFGYYAPEISKSLSRDGSRWRAAFAVTPGEPVRITSLTVRLTGDGSSDPNLTSPASRFPLRVGDILDHRLYEEGKKKMTSAALTAGYRDVSFTSHQVEVDPEKHSATVLLVLDSGPRSFFGTTTFVADFLSHDFLRRLLPYREGDPFSPKALVELRQTLLGTEYFSDVEVSAGEPVAGSPAIPILVSLAQRNPNKYSFGIGYGTDSGARCSAEWTSRLLNRAGHQATIQAQPSERKSYVGGVYTIPIRDPRKERLSLLGKWEKDYFENTDTEQRTLSLSLDHIHEPGEYSLYLSWLDEDYDTGLETGHATLLTPGLKTTWRLADDRLRTGRGLRLVLDLSGADRNVFADTTFLQASASAKAIVAIAGDWRAIGRLHLGGTMVDNIYDLPPLLRFYAGGDQSVRGYAYKSIGPVDSQGNVLGGRYLATYSIEIERRLTEEWSAALFVDGGDAFNELPAAAMKTGCGVGIRWNLPFGQVRLDLAQALDEGGGAWRIHFNIGADL